jgi:DNA-binding transcriptional LysR family regulator
MPGRGTFQVLLGPHPDLLGNDGEMELRHLRYFVAVAETENVGRAAERLHVSPSPLSRQIHQLEAELEVRLFDRVGRGVRLTVAGRVLLERSRALLAQADRAVKEVRLIAQGATGRLSLGFADTPAFARMMPELVTRLRARHPEVSLEIVPLSSAAQLPGLLAGTLDVGFGHEAPSDPALASEPLHTERVLLAVPQDHPLAKIRTVRARMLANEPFIWPRTGKPKLLEEVEAALRMQGITLDVALEARSSAEARLSLVASGVGLTFALASAAAALPPQVRLRPVVDLQVDGRAHLVYRARDEALPLIRAVRKTAQEVRRALFP